MSESVLEVDGLTKRYGDVVAVDAVSFTVACGKTVALLGANHQQFCAPLGPTRARAACQQRPVGDRSARAARILAGVTGLVTYPVTARARARAR